MQRPVYTVIAGPNGSGKSTLIGMLQQSDVALENYLNADDLAKKMSGPRDRANLQAQGIVRNERRAALRNRVSFSYETVMSHISHVEAMEAARSRGFVVRLFFVAVETADINVGRVEDRVSKGGHDVPLDAILKRRNKVLNDNLFPAICAAHQAFVFDNSYGEGGTVMPVADIREWHARIHRRSRLTWPNECLFAKLKSDARFTVIETQ